MSDDAKERRHYWLVSYIFKGGNGFVYVDSPNQYIGPNLIDYAIKEGTSKDENIKKAMPMCVSYLGFMTEEEAKSI